MEWSNTYCDRLRNQTPEGGVTLLGVLTQLGHVKGFDITVKGVKIQELSEWRKVRTEQRKMTEKTVNRRVKGECQVDSRTVFCTVFLNAV